MNIKEFQQQIIERCDKAEACTNEFKRLLTAMHLNDPVAFIRVLLDNHGWYTRKGIYDAASMLQIDEQDVLLRAGLPTQLVMPVDFQPEFIAGKLWKPYNEGATNGNWEGDYMTFDEAKDPKGGRLLPTENDFITLSTQKREWSIYQNQFGHLFNGRLFLPAGGYHNPYISELTYVGGSGYYWSGDQIDSRGVQFWFPHNAVIPGGTCSRSCGLQIRCIQE